MSNIKIYTFYFLIALASVSVIFFTVGFIDAVNYSTGEVVSTNLPRGDEKVVQKEIKKAKNVLNIVTLGDSIAKGTGDEKNKGIGGNLAELLKNNTAKEITVENLGIDGLKSGELLGYINSNKFSLSIALADIIVISIGGNDLRELTNLPSSEKEQSFNALVKKYSVELKEVGKKIRSLNNNVMIVYLGLYNPYEELIDSSRLATTWNYNVQLIAEEDARTVFISAQNVFKFNLKRFIAPDNLHPNSLGYHTISLLIAKALEGYVQT